MRLPILSTFVLTLSAFSPGLFAQNLLVNGGLERPVATGNFYDEYAPGSTAIPGWTIGSEGGINGIRGYWTPSQGQDCVDLHHSQLGPGSIHQDVLLTNGLHYRLSFDLAFNVDHGLPVAVEVSIGNVSQVFVRRAGSEFPFWQRESLTFTATNTGVARLTFTEQSGAPSGSPESSLDNIRLDHALLPAASLRVLDEIEFPFYPRSSLTPLDGQSRQHIRTRFVLAPNTNPHPFVVDASAATTPSGLPLTYTWSYYDGNDSDGDWFLLGGPSLSPYLTNYPTIHNRNRPKRVEATDGKDFGYLWFNVVVFTPESALLQMHDWLWENANGGDNPRSRLRRVFMRLMQEAADSFAAGDDDTGKKHLKRLQHRLRFARQPLTREQAHAVKDLSQHIIDTAHP